MTWSSVSRCCGNRGFLAARQTYRNTVVVLLANALRFGLALLEGVLVLELGSHGDGFGGGCGCVGCYLQWWVTDGSWSCAVAGGICKREGGA
jgi:hypothetical protein